MFIDRIAILQARSNTKATTTGIKTENSQHESSFTDLAKFACAIAERNRMINLWVRTK